MPMSMYSFPIAQIHPTAQSMKCTYRTHISAHMTAKCNTDFTFKAICVSKKYAPQMPHKYIH